jgi:uncharacterized protein (TIGR00251 family)
MASFALLRVRLTPRGGRDALARYEDGVLHARVAAPPVDGAANRALIALVSEALRIPKSRIQIQSGETGRDKALRIEGLDGETLHAKLEEKQWRK